MRKLALVLCSLSLVSVALAQEPVPAARAPQAAPAAPQPSATQTPRPAVAQPDGVANGQFIPLAGEASGRAGDQCVAPFLCGQNDATVANTWQYDDATFVNPGYGSGRIICESFPPPGQANLTQAIGVLTWFGTYIHYENPPNDGCTKPHLFEVKFYNNLTNPNRPDVANPVATYTNLVPFQAVVVGQLNFGGAIPSDKYSFGVILEPPLTLGSGWFSVTSIQQSTDCFHLIGPSDEGDGTCWRYWMDNPTGGATQPLDVAYCLSPKISGACCDDCTSTCTNDASIVYCAGIGGRFLQGGLCSNMSPPCGEATGACCHDDGTCELTTCIVCEPQGPVGCVGDLNCDGSINFGDINPFVQFVSNFAAWKSAHPTCEETNGDINCDGTYGQSSFGDINPFVAVIVTCGQGCACPGPVVCAGPRAQGDYWAGPNTTCQPWPAGGCCTVVVPTTGNPHLEGEANPCAPDVTNGGCNITPPAFTPIQVGWTIYGTSGTFDPGYRDTDWYSVTTATPTSFTVTVEAEFDANVLAFSQGPNGPSDPCTGYHDVAAPMTPIPPPDGTGHNLCTPIVLATRCLPAGTYWFVVTPAGFSGVACGSDYKITLESGGSCEVQNSCATCPGGAYVEGTVDGIAGYCEDPNGVDPNGGCNLDPPVFEALPHNPDINPDTFTICGKVRATDGTRDLDWWTLDLPFASQVSFSVTTEVPIQAIVTSGDANFGPSACDLPMWGYWTATLFPVCATTAFNDTTYYQPGTHFFLVMPADAAGNPIWYGYPCPIGAADFGNDYTITMTVTGLKCENEIKAKTVAHTEAEPNCTNPLTYVDTYNSGCDGTPPGPVLTIGFDAANAWRSQSFGVADPNDPNAALKKDYDWYQFQVTGGQRRFKVYLYADFPATWEIWDPNQCTNQAGLREGVDVPLCTDAGYYTRQCYPVGTYWLRVYPTNAATCGSYYYLALTEPGQCSLCIFTPATNIPDDPCDDVTDVDTNAGCDDPNNVPPVGFMPFVCGGTYGGRIYAGLVTGAPYYDPDWFRITNTYTTAKHLRVTVTAEFIAKVEVYLSCADYDAGSAVPGLSAVTPLIAGTSCMTTILNETGTGSPAGTVYYGRVTCVDQFGNLMVKYYPCAKGNNRWKLFVQCI
jgi:hypothetical protein